MDYIERVKMKNKAKEQFEGLIKQYIVMVKEYNLNKSEANRWSIVGFCAAAECLGVFIENEFDDENKIIGVTISRKKFKQILIF